MSGQDYDKVLARCPLFRRDASMLAEVKPLLTREDVPAGTYLFQEANPGNAMFIVGSGLVALQKRLHGEVHPLLTLKPGEYFGEICVLVPGVRMMSAKTLETSVLFKLNHNTLEQLKQSSPGTAIRLYDAILRFFVLRYRFAQPVFERMMADAFERNLFKPEI